MNKIFATLSVLFFALFAVVGCADNGEITTVGPDNDPSLEDGSFYFSAEDTDVFIMDEDVTVTFQVKSRTMLSVDVEIDLTVGDGPEGMVSFESDQIIIPAGEQGAEGRIIFSKDFFQDSSARIISVGVVASTETVNTETDARMDFDVRKYIYGAPEVRISVDTVNVEVFSEDVPVTITMTSDIRVQSPVSFTVSFDGADEGTHYSAPDKTITINAGEKEGSIVMTLLRSGFESSNPNRPEGTAGDNARIIGIKVASDDDVNIMRSWVVINPMGGYYKTYYCRPYIYRVTAFNISTFTIGYYTLDVPFSEDFHYYENLVGSYTKPVGRIEIPKGKSDFILTPFTMKGYAAECYAAAWIDYNRDGDFLDEGELVVKETYLANYNTNGSVVVTSEITVPDWVKPGTSTIMRFGTLEKAGDTHTTSGACGYSPSAHIVDVRVYIVEPKEAITFTGNLSNNEVVVQSTDVVKTITATLPQNATENVIINVNVSGANENNYILASKTITIPTGSKSASTTITFKSTSYQSELQKETYTVELAPKDKYSYTGGSGTSATFNVKGYGSKPTVYMETTESTTVTVPTGSDKPVKLKVYLSQAESGKAVNVNVGVDVAHASMVTISPSTVVFPAGNTTPVEVTLTFKSEYFVFSDNTQDVKVSITTSDAILDPGRQHITFNVKGAAERPALISIHFYSNEVLRDVTDGDASFNVPFWAPGTLTSEGTFELYLEGEDAEKAYFPGNVSSVRFTFGPGKNNTAYHGMKIKQSAFEKGVGGTVTLRGRPIGISNIVFTSTGTSTFEHVITVTRN